MLGEPYLYYGYGQGLIWRERDFNCSSVREETNGKLHNGMIPVDDMLTYARSTFSIPCCIHFLSVILTNNNNKIFVQKY